MDIAKIRKRLKEAKEAKKAGGKPEAPEDLAQDIPVEQPPTSEAEASEAKASEDRLVGEELLAPEEGTLAPEEELLIEEEPPAPEASSEQLSVTEKPLPEKKETEKYSEEKSPVTAQAGVPPVPEMPDVVEDELVELLTFKLLKEDYAFRVSDVEEILRPQRYANVPKADGFILGITSLRGKIIPLVDLRLRFGFKEGAVGDAAEGAGAAGMKPKILILKGPKGSIGALVDRVIDVIRIPPDEIAEPPSNLTESEAKFIEGVALSEGRFISVVRLEEAMNFNVSEGGL